MAKNLPAMQETGVQSLGWEDSLEEGMATQAILLACRISWTDHRVTELDTTEQLSLTHICK